MKLILFHTQDKKKFLQAYFLQYIILCNIHTFTDWLGGEEYFAYRESLRRRLQSGSVDGGLGGIIGNGPLG